MPNTLLTELSIRKALATAYPWLLKVERLPGAGLWDCCGTAAGRRTTAEALHAMAYNKDQWIESFEGQLAILRPHLTPRVLATMSLQAWHQFGVSDVDPIKVARELSKLLDRQATAASKKP